MAYIIDQRNCSGCHRCRVECPSDAISFKNRKYWIDEDECVDCGHCVTVCHNACISSSEPEKAAPLHELIKLDCDVVVIGGGAAGMTAGAIAASKGKKVIVLEKNFEVGGSAWYAHMTTMHYTKWHEEAGLPDKREKQIASFMKQIPSTNEKLLRRMFDANEKFFNWLITDHDLGKDFKLGQGGWGGWGLVSTYEEEYNKKRIDTTIGPGGHGWFLVNKLLGIIESSGGRVLLNSAAERLITDTDGAVLGVIARDGGGELQITAKSVVVASGSFTRSREIMDKMQPIFYEEKPGREPVHIFTCSTCTGDSLTICEQIGADIDYENRRVNLFGPMHHPFPAVGLAGSRANTVTIMPDGSKYEGRMMMTEVSPLASTDKRYAWNVTSKAHIAKSIAGQIGQPTDVVGIPMDDHYKNWERWLEIEENDGGCVSADTLEELAEKTGMELSKLKATLDNYNHECDNPPPMNGPMMKPPGGDDEDEGGGMHFPMPQREKIIEGPYYAFFMKLFHENAVGGMVIDDKTAVLRDGEPIPGLFAAGDTTRGIMVPGELGVGLVEMTLTALTAAFCLGYIAGVEAAEYAG